ncbi:hypothetical protein niasHT_026962 [Heterodera trifolii]|uniref:ubiquitinyl hydrolase 1 n=1 Tax=Heterodera trifolii TaxID=157864 RepID=A0ABD2KRK2_9BILA
MYIATSQSCNGISGEPSSSSPPVNLRSGALRGGRKVTKEPAYAFILPNLEQYPADFRHFLERDIIEISTLRRLENSGHLNWWCQHDSNQRLWPLVTTGDGNCLLHAASLGIWGVHDRQLNWRNTLHDVLKFGSRKHAIYRRWRWHESKNNLASGLVLSEEEWRREWNAVLELASPTPRPNPSDNNCDTAATSSSSAAAADNEQNEKEGTATAQQQQQQDQVYESLECVHVFALAHILHRPIIVVADTILRNAKGEELAPIPFGGIYLPLECPPEQCHRSPLLLCFDQSHFSALVAMRQSISTTLQVIPITDKNRNLLPVHFSVDPGPDFTWWRDNDDFRIAHKIEAIQSDDRRLELISRYMDIVRLDLRRGSVRKTVPMPLLAAMNGAGANFEDGTLRSNGGGGPDAIACSSYMLPPVPNKLLTLAAGGVPSSSASDCAAAAARAGSSSSGSSASSSILKEIRQHFRRLGRKLSLLSARRHTQQQQQYHQPRCSLPTAMEEETQQQHNQQQQQRMMMQDEVDGWTMSAKADQHHHQQQQYNNNNNCGSNSNNHHHQYQQNGTNSSNSNNKKGHHRSHSTTPFAAAELLQDNHVVLTVLLHNYAHQYIDSMLTLYIAKAKERFERAKMMPHSALPPLPKNRLSRSFSTASVLLTCLNAHCQRVAQPSNNFLCDACFAAQKRELTRTLIGGSGAANAALAAASSAANISATTTSGGGSGNNKGTAIILIRANDDDDDEQKRSAARKNNATKNDSNISTTTNSHRSHCDISTIC